MRRNLAGGSLEGVGRTLLEEEARRIGREEERRTVLEPRREERRRAVEGVGRSLGREGELRIEVGSHLGHTGLEEGEERRIRLLGE